MAAWRRVARMSLVVAAGAALLAPGAADAAPSPISAPGGLTPKQAIAQQSSTARAKAAGTCIADGAGVCIVKDTSGRRCTTNGTDSTIPTSIRVLVHTPSIQIVTVPFQTYVENVLPNEWIPSWDGDALKAGAVAVKSYAWYWVLHYGGYLNTDSPTTCFDVTDDTNFQVYKANSAQARTNTAVVATWPVAARVNGKILQASYRAELKSSTESCGQYADGSTLSQWGSQNCVEENTGNKYNVILQKYYANVQLATTRQLRTPHDFQFEQTSTRVSFTNGKWLLDDGYGTAFSWGTKGDQPVITDSGDGFAHIGVWRPSNGTWYLAGPTGATSLKLQWGWSGDVPVPGHYAGSGSPSVPAVWRASTGSWYIYGQASFVYGNPGDVPVPADYNGDGTTDVAVWRPSNGTWYFRGRPSVQWGTKGDIPVPADYNGDGTVDIAVYRPSNHRWYVRGNPSVAWGTTGDVPVIGDFNGDGKADLTMYRPSNQNWYTRGQTTVTFGPSGATPIGAAPYRA